MVRRNVKLRDMNTTVPVNDAREIGIANAPRSPTGSGHHPAKRRQCLRRGMCEAAAVNGAVLHRARRDKETKYAVVPIETGGRWGEEVIRFVDTLASARSREAPSRLQRSAFLAWRRRWTRMLAFSCSWAFAGSLTSNAEVMEGVDGATPDVADLFGQDQLQGGQF